MKIVEIRDTWVEEQLNNVVLSMVKDIIDGYKNTLLRGQNTNIEQ
jgi:hypothetical protein